MQKNIKNPCEVPKKGNLQHPDNADTIEHAQQHGEFYQLLACFIITWYLR
jgi:hypothetical protein